MVNEEPQSPPEEGAGAPDETAEATAEVEGSPAEEALGRAGGIKAGNETPDGNADDAAPSDDGEHAERAPGDETGEADASAGEAGEGPGVDEAEAATTEAEPSDGGGDDSDESAAAEFEARAMTSAAPAGGSVESEGTAAETSRNETAEGQAAPEGGEPSKRPPAPEPQAVGATSAAASAGPAVGRWLRREARPRPPMPSRYTTEAPEWLEPEFEHQMTEVPSPPFGRSPGRLPALVLALLMSGVFLTFVLIEPTPTWALLFGAIIAALGTDGALRSIRHKVFEREGGPDTVPHLFLPTLFALAIPSFIEENLQSYWVIPAALVAGIAFVAIVLAEVPAEEAEQDEFRGRARFVSVAMTYFVAFAVFSLAYAFDLGLRESLIPIALVSVLLAVGLLREGEVDPLETLLLAGVVGVVVAEARWVLNYLPIDAYPAGLALVLVFYFVTGMVHAYMTRHINVTVAAEYTIVTVLGLGLVIAARATGIA